MSCQQVPTAPALTSCPRSTQVEEFEVASSGGIWVAAGGGGDKAMTVKRDKVGPSFGRIEADALVEIERCLAVFLGIAK